MAGYRRLHILAGRVSTKGPEMSDESSMTIDIQAPIERVWEAVATERGLRDWLNPQMVLEPHVGGRIEYPGQQMNEPFVFTGQIVGFEPERKLAFDWSATPSASSASRRVTISLDQQGDLVCVTLRHDDPSPAGDGAASEQRLWMGDELVPLKELVEGVGPTL